MFDIEDDNIFSGSPVDKWLEIVFHSNRGLAEEELRRLLESLAICEGMLDSLDPSWEQKMTEIKNQQESLVQERMGNLAIESMGKILTQLE